MGNGENQDRPDEEKNGTFFTNIGKKIDGAINEETINAGAEKIKAEIKGLKVLYDKGTNMDEKNKKKSMLIIKGSAILLCIFFFTMPLVQCTQNRNLTATGWEIATGTGDLYGYEEAGNDPFVFLLIIVPVLLLVLAFRNKSFARLRIVSAAGVVCKIIFLIAVQSRISSAEFNVLRLTGANWFILFIYIALVCFTHYCMKQEKASQTVVQTAAQEEDEA